MAVASSSSSASVIFGGFCSSHHNFKTHERNYALIVGKSRHFLSLPRLLVTPSTLTFSLRRNNKSAITSSSNKKKKKNKSVPQKSNVDADDIDEDAIEALFNQLEEDLRNDPSLDDGDEELSEEDLARLEKELEEALGDDDALLEMFKSSAEGMENNDDTEGEEEEEEVEEEEDDDEEERPLELKNWQLRRLASALKIGRRKTSIKSLAAELCLDRALVLELLRDPPPNLLLMSAALPDKVVSTTSEPETKSVEPSTETMDVMEPSMETSVDVIEAEPSVKVPVHVMQSRWTAQKRLKKVQIETLERVYNRTKRPTNAMISSIVHVTNLPKKRVVKWFEDKRAEDGISHQRLPYQRTTPETIVS
ncbi:Homeobox domain [Macleaya cordata]|uniref:Homeobox domain n=1 Tax=Macleaya cordata TaxID=56857 RepID=A0A200PQJ5_MACCD|nr:Homeobox domain [Macleaya cordata]